MARLELWGVRDIARALRVHPATARKWTGLEGFPARAGAPDGRACYHANDVRDWHRRRIKEKRERRAF